MLGYCGRDCDNCEAFNNAGSEKEQCTGCRSEGPGSNILGKDCAIRVCARTKRQAICANCPDFPCSKLQSVLSENPNIEQQLRSISGTPDE